MAKSLNLSSTAVGVEDPMQLDFLKKRGCVEAQGKLFAPSMSAEDMTQFLLNVKKNNNTDFKTLQSHQELRFDGSKEIH
jgi:EAL domain-containing protein (putative c-di-GMP-specific phosphodiesterase class I)